MNTYDTTEQQVWDDAYDTALTKGWSQQRCIDYADQKLDAYLATGIYY